MVDDVLVSANIVHDKVPNHVRRVPLMIGTKNPVSERKSVTKLLWSGLVDKITLPVFPVSWRPMNGRCAYTFWPCSLEPKGGSFLALSHLCSWGGALEMRLTPFSTASNTLMPYLPPQPSCWEPQTNTAWAPYPGLPFLWGVRIYRLGASKVLLLPLYDLGWSTVYLTEIIRNSMWEEI